MTGQEMEHDEQDDQAPLTNTFQRVAPFILFHPLTVAILFFAARAIIRLY